MHKFFKLRLAICMISIMLFANFSFAQNLERNSAMNSARTSQPDPCQTLTDADLKASCEAMKKNMSQTKSDILEKYATPMPLSPIMEAAKPTAKPEPLFKSIPPAANPPPPSPVIAPAPPFNLSTSETVNASTVTPPAQNLLQPKQETKRSMYQ